MVPARNKIPTSPLVGRLNLRLTPAQFQSIDAARERRPGKISHITWITEAIQERLSREVVANDPQAWKAGGVNG